MPVKLWTFTQVATHSGFSEASLVKIAQENGLVIQCGRSKKIREDEIEELFENCRVGKKVQASSKESARGGHAPGSSKTPAGMSARPARAAAAKLKQSSRNTSPASSGQVVQLPQTN